MPKSTSRLVVGQSVVCRKTERLGQVLGVASPSEVCTVRYADNGEVANEAAENLRVATWEDLRGKSKSNDTTRLMPKLRTDVPGQE